MALSSISGAALAKGQVANQKNVAEQGSSDAGRSNLASGDSKAGNSYSDSVTLSKAEKSSEAGRVVDLNAAEELLPKTMDAIRMDSTKALSAQANTRPEAAIDYLAGS